MLFSNRVSVGAGVLLFVTLAHASRASAQTVESTAQDHSHMAMSSPGWTFMQDGVLTALSNHQGGPRGGNDWFIAPNWWMGMAARSIGRQRVQFNAMLSLDPATVGRRGYHELFQVG